MDKIKSKNVEMSRLACELEQAVALFRSNDPAHQETAVTIALFMDQASGHLREAAIALEHANETGNTVALLSDISDSINGFADLLDTFEMLIALGIVESSKPA